MVEKMPHIAVDGLDQFVIGDNAFRKDYFFLNFLEYDPKSYREESVTTDEHGVAIVHDKKTLKQMKRKKKLQCTTTPLKVFFIFYCVSYTQDQSHLSYDHTRYISYSQTRF